jgi:hypothetical protein
MIVVAGFTDSPKSSRYEASHLNWKFVLSFESLRAVAAQWKTPCAHSIIAAALPLAVACAAAIPAGSGASKQC